MGGQLDSQLAHSPHHAGGEAVQEHALVAAGARAAREVQAPRALLGLVALGAPRVHPRDAARRRFFLHVAPALARRRCLPVPAAKGATYHAYRNGSLNTALTKGPRAGGLKSALHRVFFSGRKRAPSPDPHQTL
jgi:hypothetical protein